MRIRKNLKLCSTSSSSSEDATFHAHMCQLNQSPWDLIPFDSHSSFYQFEYDDSSFTATAAANGDSSIGAVESSVASMMDIDEQAKLEDVAAIAMMELTDDNNTKGSSAKVVVTTNNNGSGGNSGGSCNKKPAAAASESRGSRASANKPRAVGFKKPTAATSSSTNPYEFYYYSGFGPTWSTKRRGDRSKNNGVENSAALQRSDIRTTTSSIAPSTTTTPINDVVVVVDSDKNNNSTIMEENVEELDYDLDLVDDDEEDDYDDDDNYGKNKRMRKPVKARSLKSLM